VSPAPRSARGATGAVQDRVRSTLPLLRVLRELQVDTLREQLLIFHREGACHALGQLRIIRIEQDRQGTGAHLRGTLLGRVTQRLSDIPLWVRRDQIERREYLLGLI
jgi:hypothetical protein